MPATTIDITLAETGSPLHAGELDLRYRLLRAPLGMPRGSEWYSREQDCLHVVAVQRAAGAEAPPRVVGCAVFHPTSELGGRLLQMAVDEPLQGRGLGRRLVRRLESEVADRGFREVVLHARDNAVGFYERLGYACFGEAFVEVGIGHRLMRRRLDDGPT